MSRSRREYNRALFGKVSGTGCILVDTNTEFTEYLAGNIDSLVKYAKTLPNIDLAKAEDLVNDLWISYKKNEADGRGFDSSKGHGDYICIEEAIKARMKLMAKNDSEKGYARNSGSSREVDAHFSFDSDDKDDALQRALTLKAVEARNELDEVEIDIQESMMYFVACTSDCRITGLSLLDGLDSISALIAEGSLTESGRELFGDIWNKGAEVIEAFKIVLNTYLFDHDKYNECLHNIREEYIKCQTVLEFYKTQIQGNCIAEGISTL